MIFSVFSGLLKVGKELKSSEILYTVCVILTILC